MAWCRVAFGTAGLSTLFAVLAFPAAAQPAPRMEGGAPAVSGPDVVCLIEARGKKIAFVWNVGSPATLTVEDTTTVPMGICQLDAQAQRHAVTQGFPRYVYEFSGKACLQKHPLMREPVHDFVTLIVYPEQGMRAQLFWSAIAPVDDCRTFNLGPAAAARARANRVE